MSLWIRKTQGPKAPKPKPAPQPPQAQAAAAEAGKPQAEGGSRPAPSGGGGGASGAGRGEAAAAGASHDGEGREGEPSSTAAAVPDEDGFMNPEALRARIAKEKAAAAAGLRGPSVPAAGRGRGGAVHIPKRGGHLATRERPKSDAELAAAAEARARTLRGRLQLPAALIICSARMREPNANSHLSAAGEGQR